MEYRNSILRAAENLAWADFFALEIVQAFNLLDGRAVLVGNLSETVAATHLVEPAFADFLLVSSFDFLKLVGIERDGNIPERTFGKIIDSFWVDIDSVVAHFEMQMSAKGTT